MSDLTEEERLALQRMPGLQSDMAAVDKALRIIDAQAAALERVRAHVRNSGGSCNGEVILTLASTEPSKEGDAP